jgi:hypothetical protein
MRRTLPATILLFALAGSALADSKAEMALQSQIASLQSQIAGASKARQSQLEKMQVQLTAAAADRTALLQAVAGIRADMPAHARIDATTKNHAETMNRIAETNIVLDKVLALGDNIRQLVTDGQKAEAARTRRIAKRDNEADLARRLQVITASAGALQFVLIVLLVIGRRRQ